MTSITLAERLRRGLKRTRERFRWTGANGPAGDIPDWDALEESLFTTDIGMAATEEILTSLRSRPGDVGDRLREELTRLLSALASAESSPRPPELRPYVTMVVGVNGVGKTTSVAKLAHRAVAEGRKSLIVAADTFRAAAQEQLATWADRAGAELVEGSPGADPASVVHDGLQAAKARGVSDVFIDTAGRLHTKRPLLLELGKVARVAGRVVDSAPHETLLVMDATVGSNGLAQARQFAEALRIDGIILTKLDGTAKGGVVVAIARELSLPVRFTGIGEAMEDLLPFEPRAFVEALVGV